MVNGIETRAIILNTKMFNILFKQYVYLFENSLQQDHRVMYTRLTKSVIRELSLNFDLDIVTIESTSYL